MNGANRSQKRISYRQRAYRRRKIKYIIILSAMALAVVFTVLMIVGSILDRKVDTVIASLKDLETSQVESGTSEDDAHAAPQSFFAKPTVLSAEGTTLDSRLASLAADGISAVCFELESADGSLTYDSPVAQGLGRQDDGSSLWELDKAMANFTRREMYSIGITYVPELKSDNDLTRSAAIGYYGALIAEALRAGVNEVIIIPPSPSPDRLAELIQLADEVHRLVPEGRVGLALPYPLPEYPNEPSETDTAAETEPKFSDALISDLWSSFDLFAIDICNGASSTEEIESRMGELLYHILRYNMRILVPSDNEALATQVAELCEERNFKNLQFMP